ncbi:MAG: cyclic nucleotide-binding domain-containing protein, partial [Weeksellaceae bacterium]|nr:cyclic nucleotide-binding domain-containing protein [Weeksellaceae bacterium]
MSSKNHKNSDPVCSDCANSFDNLFCKIKGSKLDELIDEKTFTKYSKGEFIFKEGTRPFGIFCMKSGKVKLVKAGEDGRNHILRLHRPGDLLG